ncbi:MAG: hypothetical protein AAGJ70_12635 [Pseudomonadota bacterium]
MTFEICLPDKRRVVTVKPTGKFDLPTRTLADIKAAPGVLAVEVG